MSHRAALVTGSSVLLLCSCPSGDGRPADAGRVVEAPVDGEARADARRFLDAPLLEQVDAVERGELDCRALVEAYLERIAERDEGPEGINALISLAEDPGAAAERLEERRGDGLGLLCGVIAIKDNIDQADLPNTAGSVALAANVPAEDAPLVARLREAGALVIGRTNLSEWANFRGRRATSGWSSLGGQTRNGANPAYNPCGSSSGSGAAVAAGLVAAAIGTETDGSITCPAAVNGVVGLKPTVGLVSRAGIVPISHTMDTAGPITRTVADAARLLAVMAGPDPLDPATERIPSDLDLDFEAALEGATLDGARLGAVTSMTGYDAELDALFEAELGRLEEAGATVVPVRLPTGDAYGDDETTILLHEFKVGIDDYLESHPCPGQPATLAGLIDFNWDNADVVMPFFGQELFVDAEATTGLDAPGYLAALRRATEATGADGIVAVMEAEDLDALVAPTTGPAWATSYATGDDYAGGASGPAAVSGSPHITVPMGALRGRPVGLSLFAGPWQDGRVLALAHAYEALRR